MGIVLEYVEAERSEGGVLLEAKKVITKAQSKWTINRNIKRNRNDYVDGEYPETVSSDAETLDHLMELLYFVGLKLKYRQEILKQNLRVLRTFSLLSLSFKIRIISFTRIHGKQ